MFSSYLKNMVYLLSLKTKEKSNQNQEALPKLSGRILGNLNDTIKDIGVNPIVNYANKAKGAKVNPDLTLKDVKSFIKTPQTRRSLLSICNAVYNPLGLESQYTIKLKLLMKDMLSGQSWRLGHTCIIKTHQGVVGSNQGGNHSR